MDKLPTNPATTDNPAPIAPILPGQPSVVSPDAAPGHANGPGGGNIGGPPWINQPD
jgi:hypothetical protein